MGDPTYEELLKAAEKRAGISLHEAIYEVLDQIRYQKVSAYDLSTAILGGVYVQSVLKKLSGATE